MKYIGIFIVLTTILFLSVLNRVHAQISAPGSSATVQTEYPSFPETDNIYIFCTGNEGIQAADLQAQTLLTGTKNFQWEKYNPASGSYEIYLSESTQGQQSAVSSLEDGGYRVTITQGETVEIYRAWVFNNNLSANASVDNSTCESFVLKGSFTSPALTYYDPANNAALDIPQDIMVEWLRDQTTIGSMLEQTVFDPPAADTEYTLRVFSRFGCEASAVVTYESIVTKAQFRVEYIDQNPNEKLEAPLTVNFINESENGDRGRYEWFFYRDLEQIKEESENTLQPVDSIMIVAYDDNPTFTYENTGTYMVKLVSKKVSEFHTCVDTFYMPQYIIIDPSFIEAPNVFTPNGDGTNDVFIIKFRSMQNIKISIFNRWGKRIHFWESNNVRGFDESFTEAVWDGRIGGRFATPGVYYYVAEGRGRDNEPRSAKGFFHLFRGND